MAWACQFPVCGSRKAEQLFADSDHPAIELFRCPPLELVSSGVNSAQVGEIIVAESAGESNLPGAFLGDVVRAEHLGHRHTLLGEPSHRGRLVGDQGVRDGEAAARGRRQLHGLGGCCHPGGVIDPQHRKRRQHPTESILGLEECVLTLCAAQFGWKLEGSGAAVPDRSQLF
jgi:hypothetical protein